MKMQKELHIYWIDEIICGLQMSIGKRNNSKNVRIASIHGHQTSSLAQTILLLEGLQKGCSSGVSTHHNGIQQLERTIEVWKMKIIIGGTLLHNNTYADAYRRRLSCNTIKKQLFHYSRW